MAGRDRVRAAEVVAALSLATDLGIGVPFEHGQHSTLFAMRLAERLGIDPETASQTYYACLLFYVGCTANADLNAELFGDELALTTHATPTRSSSPSPRPSSMCRVWQASRHCGRWRIGWPRTHSRAPRDGHNPYRRPDGTNRLRPPVTEQSSTGDLSSTRHFRTEPGGLPRQAARGREAQRDVADIMTVSDRLALFNRRVTNPIVRLFAGRRWSPVAVVVHRGRRSGRRYRTPVIAFGTDDGYLISLPYGTERDWVSNVVATGSCTLERTGRRIELTSPKVLAQHQAMPLLPWPVRTGLRLLRIRSVLQLSAR